MNYIEIKNIDYDNIKLEMLSTNDIISLGKNGIFIHNLDEKIVAKHSDISYIKPSSIVFVKTSDEYFYLSIKNLYGNIETQIHKFYRFLYESYIEDIYTYTYYKCDQIEGLIECIKMLKNEKI